MTLTLHERVFLTATDPQPPWRAVRRVVELRKLLGVIHRLTDGTYRIRPKVLPQASEVLALTAVGGGTPPLGRFDPPER